MRWVHAVTDVCIGWMAIVWAFLTLAEISGLIILAIEG